MTVQCYNSNQTSIIMRSISYAVVILVFASHRRYWCFLILREQFQQKYPMHVIAFMYEIVLIFYVFTFFYLCGIIMLFYFICVTNALDVLNNEAIAATSSGMLTAMFRVQEFVRENFYRKPAYTFSNRGHLQENIKGSLSRVRGHSAAGASHRIPCTKMKDKFCTCIIFQ